MEGLFVWLIGLLVVAFAGGVFVGWLVTYSVLMHDENID